jgi:hypothetical protein
VASYLRLIPCGTRVQWNFVIPLCSATARHSFHHFPRDIPKVLVVISEVTDVNIQETNIRQVYSFTPLELTTFMWNSRLRTSLIGSVAAPGRAFASSFTRGRRSPRVPRDVTRRLRPVAHNRGALSPQQFEPTSTEPNRPTPNYDPAQNTLLSPVHIPEDPNGILKETHPAMGILANSGLVIQRQLELMNVMMYAAHVSQGRPCQS